MTHRKRPGARLEPGRPLSPLIILKCTAYLSRSYLNVEVAPLIGDLKDLWPGEAVDPQPIPVNQQAVGTDAQHYVDPFRILRPTRDSKEAEVTYASLKSTFQAI